MWKWLAAAAFTGILAEASLAEAQTLSNGDYELCSVYRHDGRFAGYDSACLERQRAAIRRLSNRHNDYARPAYGHQPAPSYSYAPTANLCPSWANNGNGFSSTIMPGGGFNIRYGTFNAAYNGQPCIPNPVYILRGVP